MTERRDEERVREFREGGEAAFEALFRRFERLLAARIQGRLPPDVQRRVSVADVLQETHLAAYESRERMTARDVQALKSWLLSIADHKALQHVRHHGETARRSVRREVTRTGRPTTQALSRRQASASQVAIAAETLELARRARAKLPPDHAEVLRLAREEGVPLREVATRMNRSYDAVKKLYGRALCRFKVLFDELRGEGDA